MTQIPVLAMPDFNQLFIIEADASRFGVGAVLMQSEHPLAFFSKVLGQRARQKSMYEKELMAIVLSVMKWPQYLLGRKFIIRTDQQSLRFLMAQKEVGSEYQRWMSKLLGYEFEIQYKPGAHNKMADALSHKEHPDMECSTLISAGGIKWEDFQQQVHTDPFIQQLVQAIQQGQPVPKGYSIEHGILKYKGRMVIPGDSNLVTKLLT